MIERLSQPLADLPRDRGAIGQSTLELLQNDRTVFFDSIFGCRLRLFKEVAQDVLAGQAAISRSRPTSRF